MSANRWTPKHGRSRAVHAATFAVVSHPARLAPTQPAHARSASRVQRAWQWVHASCHWARDNPAVFALVLILLAATHRH